MAQRQGKLVKYKKFQLYEDQVLGHGSYGSVCKAKYDDLLCAAKIIYRHLCDHDARLQVGPQREHRHPIQRFERECEFMKAIRHPNIVQFLGIVEHPQQHVPVLLTELMDCSLTHFLEKAQLPIPYHIQVNFCHDIALALSFLHSNEIIHRDLSSNNVLLIGDVRAKVTDFGMAKVTDLDSRAISMTRVPGTDVYMPPEAVEDHPEYTEKIDGFSFGVTTLQILTRKFPEPGNRYQQIGHPDFPQNRIQRCIPEIDRRHSHISIVNKDHPLLNCIVLDCINDNAHERPTSHELCRRLEKQKCEPRYSESRNTIPVPDARELNDTSSVQRNQIGELQQQIEVLNQQLERKTQLLQEKDQTIENMSQQLTVCELITNFQSLNSLEHEQPEQRMETTLNEPQSSVNSLSGVNTVTTEEGATATASTTARIATEQKFNFKWKRARNLSPYQLSRETCTTAMCGSKLYFNQGKTREVYAYNPVDDTWSQLPKCSYQYSTLAVVKGSLTAVGGEDPQNQTITNELVTLVGSSVDTKQWSRTFPSMLKQHRDVVTVWNDSVLVVIGGVTYGFVFTRVDCADVEVLDINNSQWCKAVPLPMRPQEFGIPYDNSTTTAVICGNCIYVLADNEREQDYDYQEFSELHVCTLNTLLKSCEPKFRGQIPEQDLSISGTKWRHVTNCSRAKPTCVSYNDQLLTIGGTVIEEIPQMLVRNPELDDNTETRAVNTVEKYNSVKNSWENVSYTSTPRFSCFATVLPHNEILVMGGYNSVTEMCDPKDFADVVEIATVTIT